MGAGASASLEAGIKASSETDLQAALGSLSADLQGKLRKALEEPAQKKMKDMAFGKWTDEQVAGAMSAMLAGKMGPGEEMLRKVRPFLMPEYKTTISIGQAAPDGKVFELDGTETTLLQKMAALGHGDGKLMVLNFGSYTCPVHRGAGSRVEEICRDASVTLLHVYIAEAHPKDEWDGGPVNGVEYKQTTSMEERYAIANAYRAAQNVTGNMVIDDMANSCDIAYEARATRLYVIESGNIIWRTGTPPFQYDVEGLKDFLASKCNA
eukprot:TRINITY_DN9552_c0_g1_i1.p1 TRINITY_DN9552_c0_g1~~TRINITY_DN9552_c0_g1_i1.p1  ORF type:complete len:266 (+),score=77.49 TRINITY_DN9552_c0_g1_i1:69-866(+)